MVELFNEDCKQVLARLLDKSVDLVITDPPYVLETSGAGFFGKKSDEYKKNFCGAKAYTYAGERYVMKQFSAMKDGFDDTILDELCRVMKEINIYLFCSQKQIEHYLDYFVVQRGCNWNMLTWHKTDPIPACGNKYLTDTEFLLYFRAKGVKLYGNYETKRTWYVSTTNMEDKAKYGHPTCKPTNIIRNLVINSSQPGDIVLDPFMGSGTTGEVCKLLGRDFIGCEIDEKYFQTAKERIDNIQLELW